MPAIMVQPFQRKICQTTVNSKIWHATHITRKTPLLPHTTPVQPTILSRQVTADTLNILDKNYTNFAATLDLTIHNKTRKGQITRPCQRLVVTRHTPPRDGEGPSRGERVAASTARRGERTRGLDARERRRPDTPAWNKCRRGVRGRPSSSARAGRLGRGAELGRVGALGEDLEDVVLGLGLVDGDLDLHYQRHR
jgi:hypothetical protein